MKSKSAPACYIQDSKHFRTMRLRGQDDTGYAMAMLLVGMSVAAIMMTMALPVWKQTAQREKEEELVFRGLQYVRALRLFSAKYANAAPPSLDVLVEQRFLRKKYKDPITNDDFQPILAGQAIPGAAAPPQRGGGAGRGTSPTGGTSGASPTGGTSPFGGGITGSPSAQTQTGRGGPAGTSAIGSPGAGGVGGIMGVVSKSKDKSIRLYQGRTHYNEWAFINTPQTQAPGQGVPGTAAPGQRGTPGQPGQGQNPFGTGIGGGRGQQPTGGGRGVGPGGFPVQPGTSPFQPGQSPFGSGQPTQPIQPGRGGRGA